MSKTKRCKVCHEYKELVLFPRNNRAQDGHNGICRDCQGAINSKRADSRKEKASKDPEAFTRRIQRYLWALSRRRAKEKGLEHTISPEDIQVPDVCPVLQIPLNTYRGGFDRSSYSLDRVDSSKGYVPGNVRVLSWRANAIKSNLTVEEVKRLLAYMEGEN